MKNKPNGYRVYHTVQVTDTYGESQPTPRVTDIKSLGSAESFRGVKAVYPIFIEVSDTPVSQQEIDGASATDWIVLQRDLADRRLQLAERELLDAKAAMEAQR